MSTRSAVRIAGWHTGYLDLYRHFDGYPAEAGATLLAALKDADRPETVALRLLSEERGGNDTKPQYEITDAEQHGDLEHVYVVERIRGNWGEPPAGWTITHYERGHNWDQDDWMQWAKLVYSLDKFAGLVNLERREMNARMIDRGIDSEPYPMVSA